jgi:DNA-binding GntR family transcriptional regulator
MRIAMEDRAVGLPAREQAYETLREAIVSAELEPGRRLSENELAARLGVSRTPVREALARLRDERLVDIVPQLGSFVTRIDADAVADAQFVRESLECHAIRLTAERITPVALAELEAILAAQGHAVQSSRPEAFDELDDALHRTLCNLSGHEVAWRLSSRARGPLERVRRLSLPEPGFRAKMLEEHQAVVAAVAAGDPDVAEATLRHHLDMVLSILPDLRRTRPQYFESQENS